MRDAIVKGGVRAASGRRRKASARRRLLAPWLALLLALGACDKSETFPGGEWEKREPAELGLDEGKLDELEGSLGGDGVAIVRGYSVARWGQEERKTDWYSAAKPVFSTLLLFALQEGLISSVDAPVADFGWKLRPVDQTMVLRHLANMMSGYRRPEPPGAAFSYNDPAINLYQQTLFERIFREAPEQVANDPERLGALGFEEGLSFAPKTRRLHASPRDFARIAWFWLKRGRWNERQLLPASYFDDYMRPQVPADLPHTARGKGDDYLGVGSFGGGSDHFTRAGPGIYGFNWWFNERGRDHPDEKTWPDAPDDTVLALGVGGRAAVLFPSLDAVVVAAGAKWGDLDPGNRRAHMNRMFALAAEALTPRREAMRESQGESAPRLSGELEKWHRVTLTFDGPGSGEEDDPNPFLDHRLDVTFSHGERELTVPGFYAADGDAGESGASAGNRWRVHFAADEEGEWRWRASFRKGTEVAVSDDPQAGRATGFDGETGSFRIGPSSRSGRDHRARGRLQYVGRHHLRFAETGEWFLKGGANSPENLLAFADFDQTPPSHVYEAHAADYRPGDPTWRDGRGRNLVGALNYLASEGMNAVYFLTMNVHGDGDDVWPWTQRGERERYDVSKLDQWEVVFSHMDRLGIMLHVMTQETENDQLLDGGELGRERRLYYRELVARFAHHLALTWNLGEENTNTDAQRRAFAEYIRRLDPYDHPIVVHTYPKQMTPIYRSLLGFPAVSGASLQTRNSHADVSRWVSRSAAAGHPWVVTVDEIGPSSRGVLPDANDPGHDTVRTRHLWPGLMAGGAGVEWYFGYRFPHHDLEMEDWRSRDRMWDQTRDALDFFQRYLPFHEMESCDALLSGAPGHCLGRKPDVYAVYLPQGGEARLDLGEEAGTFEVLWFDPRGGGELATGTVTTIQEPGVRSLGLPPADRKRDWTALVRKTGRW